MTFDMAASIIAAPVSAKIACFAMRMDAVSQFEMVKGGIFEFDCVKNWWVEALLPASIVHLCADFTIRVRSR